MKHPKDTYYKRIIQSSRWQMVRNKYIREHPICENCHDNLAEVVHHRVPLMRFRDNPVKMEQMAFDEDNLMSCCNKCHEEIHKELGKNRNKKEHVIAYHKELVERAIKEYFE